MLACLHACIHPRLLSYSLVRKTGRGWGKGGGRDAERERGRGMQLRVRTLISSMCTYQGIVSSQGPLPPIALAPRTAPDPPVDPAAAAAAAAVHQLPSVGQRGHFHRPPSFCDVQSTSRHNAASGTSPKTTESGLARPTQKPPVASYACAQRRGGRARGCAPYRSSRTCGGRGQRQRRSPWSRRRRWATGAAAALQLLCQRPSRGPCPPHGS